MTNGQRSSAEVKLHENAIQINFKPHTQNVYGLFMCRINISLGWFFLGEAERKEFGFHTFLKACAIWCCGHPPWSYLRCLCRLWSANSLVCIKTSAVNVAQMNTLSHKSESADQMCNASRDLILTARLVYGRLIKIINQEKVNCNWLETYCTYVYLILAKHKKVPFKKNCRRHENQNSIVLKTCWVLKEQQSTNQYCFQDYHNNI